MNAGVNRLLFVDKSVDNPVLLVYNSVELVGRLRVGCEYLVHKNFSSEKVT